MKKAFDTVYGAIKTKEAEICAEFQINNKSLKILEDYCKVLDIIIDDGFGKDIHVFIDGKMLINIHLRLSSFLCQYEETKDAYLGLLERAISFSVSSDDGDTVVAKFIFPSVFEKKTR